MSNITTKFITYEDVGSSLSQAFSLGLYQDAIDVSDKYPSYADINLMMSYARSGKSAFAALENNKYATLVGDNVVIELDFFARPNPLGLAYSLSMNIGSISALEIVDQSYDNIIVLPMTDTITFPSDFSISSLEWASPAYDENGSLTSYPTYEIINNHLVFSHTVFAIARVKYLLTEHKYTATLTIPKTQSQDVQETTGTTEYSITGVTAIVTAKYKDEDGEDQVESLTLDFPQIISDYLAACPDDEEAIAIDWSTSEIGDPFYTTYYYSTCTGEILYTHRVGH